MLHFHFSQNKRKYTASVPPIHPFVTLSAFMCVTQPPENTRNLGATPSSAMNVLLHVDQAFALAPAYKRYFYSKTVALPHALDFRSTASDWSNRAWKSGSTNLIAFCLYVA